VSAVSDRRTGPRQEYAALEKAVGEAARNHPCWWDRIARDITTHRLDHLKGTLQDVPSADCYFFFASKYLLFQTPFSSEVTSLSRVKRLDLAAKLSFERAVALLAKEHLRELSGDRARQFAATSFGNYPLIAWAVSANDTELLGELTELGVSLVDAVSSVSGARPLHVAAFWGHCAVASWILDRDPLLIDLKSSAGETALHRASRYHRIDVIRLLAARGATMDVVSSLGSTSIDVACQKNDDVVVKELAGLGASIEVVDAETHATPLLYCASMGTEKAALALIELGAALEARDYLGRTPLHCACLAGGLGMVRLLVKSGADVAVRDGSGRRVLDSAQGKSEIVDLIEQKFELIREADREDGLCPLHFAAMEGDIKEIDRLIELGEDLNQPDGEGRSPLHWAYGAGRLLAAEYLIARGANPEAKDPWGRGVKDLTRMDCFDD